jgi:F-type H+-transporting ATPase subunit b
MKKRWLFIFALLMPAILLAGEDGQTDIVPRTVNFFIFAAIIYYLLADKIKTFFNDRTQSIQNQLDEVQMKLEESKQKIEAARVDLENAKNIASELVKNALADVNSIKNKSEIAYQNEMNGLMKNFNDKVALETRKAKKIVANEILSELFSDDNISITRDNLQNIILKKVA